MNKLVIIVVLVLIVGGGFMLFSGSKTSNESMTQEPAQTTNEAMPKEEATDSMMEEGTVKEFVVESKGLTFTPSEITVNVGDKIRITYKNTLGTHDWTLDEFNVKTQLLDAGQEETVEFVADKAGSFEYYCSVAGHRAAGMKGMLVVE